MRHIMWLYRNEGQAVKTNETSDKQTLRHSMQAVLAAAIVSMAVCGDAGAAALSSAPGSTGRAMLLFAIAWFFASLRIRQAEGRWHVGFELSPLKGINASRAQTGCAQEGRQP